MKIFFKILHAIRKLNIFKLNGVPISGFGRDTPCMHPQLDTFTLPIYERFGGALYEI
jgi:hypothetical protein